MMDDVVKADIIGKLNDIRMQHSYCEDEYYSCPKHPDGYADKTKGTECNCGADAQNKRIDEIINLIKNENKP